MNASAILMALAALVPFVTANGQILTCTSNNCGTGCAISTNEIGGATCVQIPNTKSVKGVSHDSGHIYTVYTDKFCTNGATAVRGTDCLKGNWNSFSYDAGS